MTKQLNPKWLNLLKLQFQHDKSLEVDNYFNVKYGYLGQLRYLYFTK